MDPQANSKTAIYSRFVDFYQGLTESQAIRRNRFRFSEVSCAVIAIEVHLLSLCPVSSGLVVQAPIALGIVAAVVGLRWHDLGRPRHTIGANPVETNAPPGILAAVRLVAAASGLASSFIPKTIVEFQKSFPHVRFKSFALGHDEIEARVRRGICDLGIDFGSKAQKNISVVKRVLTNTCAIISRSHPLALREKVDFHELVQYPVCISLVTTTRHMIDFRDENKGIDLEIVFESNNSNSLFYYISQTQAVGFAVPLSAWDWINRGELVAVGFTEPEFAGPVIEIKTHWCSLVINTLTCCRSRRDQD